MEEFRCLDSKTALLGNHFLEASAGTGKTFAIEHVFVRLLLDEDLLVDQLLVVTYTRAAVRDLKLRIRSKLESLLKIFQNKEKSFEGHDYLLEYLRKPPEQKRKYERKLEESLAFFDNAQIFTIHGFCLRILQEFSFEAGFRSSFNRSSFVSIRKIIERGFFDLLLYHRDILDLSPAQVTLILKRYKRDEEFLSELFTKGIREKRETISAKKLFEELRTVVQNIPLEISERSSLLEEFSVLFLHFKKTGYDYEELLVQADLLAKMIKTRSCSFDEFHLLLDTRLVSFLDEKNRKKRRQNDSLFEKTPMLSWAIFHIFPIIKKALDSNEIFFAFGKKLIERIEKRLEKDTIISYDQILHRLSQALKEDSFKRKASEKYRVVMIDEFQDTDPLQWDIFHHLFLKREPPLLAFYLVGDPKQSIYRFRYADLYTYFDAATILGPTAKKQLSTNYRSSFSLVHALNTLFSSKNGRNWLQLPRQDRSFPYFPVHVDEKVEFSFEDEKRALHFFVAEDPLSSRLLEEELFFPFIGREIVHLHIQCDIKYEEICILVKDRYQASRLKAFLEEKNIPNHTKSSSSLIYSPAAKALKRFIEAVLFCNDFQKIRIACLGPYLEWTDQRIEEEFDANISTIFGAFYQLKKTFQSKGLSHFFRDFFSFCLTKKEPSLLMRLVQRNDLSLYRDTMQLIEIMLEWQMEKKVTGEGILAFFDEYREFDPDQFPSRSIHDISSVQIMTIHRSKGLEFDVVFALGVASRTNGNVPDEELEESQAEKFRQFYVALTRARKRCYVPFTLNRTEEIGLTSPVELFFRRFELENDLSMKPLSCNDCRDYLFSLEKEGAISLEFLTDRSCSKQKQEKPTFDFSCFSLSSITRKSEGQIISFSSLATDRKMIEREIDEDYIFSSKKLPLGSNIGIQIHAILEKYFSTKASKDIKSLVYEHIRFSSLISYRDTIEEMIKRTLFCLLPCQNERISLINIPYHQCKPEMEFLYSLDEDMMKGFIDLIFFYKGMYYVVDWKTNWLGDFPEDYSPQALEREVKTQQYDLQASIYAEALRRFLKITEKKDFEKCFGGVFYLFLRGLFSDGKDQRGICFFKPDLSLVKTVVLSWKDRNAFRQE